ncbi:hypothetical protein COCOBI_10-1390 [Coccomyxa sp. Obi]|nr:hypothetical protein COCOBI_10-1390 [Coccomyxa sp. Obi]
MGREHLEIWEAYKRDINKLRSSVIPLIRQGLKRTYAAVACVLEEFEPWFKWVILDAVLALVVSLVAKRIKRARPVLRAIGWL